MTNDAEEYAKLEKSFTPEQADVIWKYIEYKLSQYDNWVKERDEELKKELIQSVIKPHRHIEDGKVYLPL